MKATQRHYWTSKNVECREFAFCKSAPKDILEDALQT